eukprot:763036-Hanusia_phi.AAC.2
MLTSVAQEFLTVSIPGSMQRDRQLSASVNKSSSPASSNLVDCDIVEVGANFGTTSSMNWDSIQEDMPLINKLSVSPEPN